MSKPLTRVELLEKFRELREVMSVSCVVADAQLRDGVMDSGMKLRTPSGPFIGTAVTVQLSPGNIVDLPDVFNLVKKGDVIVVDVFRDTETAMWGGLMSGLARAAGVEGVIIDGAARDTDEARMLGFPIVSRAVTPRSSHTPITKIFEPIKYNVPVVCGGVIVNLGDLVVADEIGVTVVPSGDLAKVYPRAVEQAEREAATRKDILAGWSFEELLAKYGGI